MILRVLCLAIAALVIGACSGVRAESEVVKGDFCAGDGQANASVGTPQNPTLLVGYRTRSPCKVAGVDYAVGRSQNRGPLKDPTNAENFASPLSYNDTQKSLRCDGGSNVTVEDFDFSLANGISFDNVSCNNVTVRHNKFKVGSNCKPPISQGPAGLNMTVEYNSIDGGGGSTATGCDVNVLGETVTFGANGGMKVFRYNIVQNVFQHYLSFTRSGGAVDVKYNYFSGCGFYQGNHCNGFQIVGGSYDNGVYAFNTYVSEQPSLPLGPVLANFLAGSNTLTDAVLDAQAAANSLSAGMTIASSKFAGGTATVVSATTTSAGRTTIVANKPAISSGPDIFSITNAYPSGMIIPIGLSAQTGGSIYGTQIYGNTIVASGPIKTISYAIYCTTESSGRSNTAAQIWGNYLDITGAFGAYFPARVCSGTFGAPLRANINMVTGAVVPGP